MKPIEKFLVTIMIAAIVIWIIIASLTNAVIVNDLLSHVR